MGTHRPYLEAAMEEAEKAYIKRTYPVGAVIVSPDGRIISRGHNHVYSKGNEDFTAHAEIETIRGAGSLLMQKENFENCTLYTTWEPCLMCCGAILLARIKRVIWVMDDDLHGGLRLLHENKLFLNNLYYMHKLTKLDISASNEQYMLERMQTWMRDWNEEKEIVLSQFKHGTPAARDISTFSSPLCKETF
jgi:tRNA(adenine34) deaminase